MTAPGIEAAGGFCYSFREMKARWLQSRVLFLLLTFAAFLTGVLPQRPNVEAPDNLPKLRFGQTFAASDFDRDGLLDVARLHASSSYKSVKILLSRTHQLVTFRFDSKHVETGSIFADDVDKDGAPDLIWSDLINSNDVVVWLGNGSGQFVRDTSRAYVTGFTLGETAIIPPDEASHETALGCESRQPLDQLAGHNTGARVPPEFPKHPSDQLQIISAAICLPADRGPPAIVS